MSEYYTIKGPKPTVSEIASSRGFRDWRVLWNHPNNAELRRKRGSDTTKLQPGDVLFIPDSPTTVVVQTNAENTVRASSPSAARKVPIFFVPGVMGSRFGLKTTDPSILSVSQDLRWDPDATDKMLVWTNLTGLRPKQKRRLFDSVITPGVTLDLQLPGLQGDEGSRGYASVVFSVYGSFLRNLHAEGIAGRLGAICPVYAIGYDWRRSNFESARFVMDRIEQVLRSENANGGIIITHSMGGLVVRSGLQQRRLDAAFSDKILGVAHCFQPVDGAPVAYRRFFTGMLNDIDMKGSFEAKMGVALIFGLRPNLYLTNQAGLRGPMELLPTTSYGIPGRASWLRLPDGSFVGPNVYSYYSGKDVPPGLMDRQQYEIDKSSEGTIDDPAVVEQELMLRIHEAENFHRTLQHFKHPKTWSIVGTGLQTDIAVSFKTALPAGKVDPMDKTDLANDRRLDGDGTVPFSSASALFPNQASDPTDVKLSNRQYQVRGVDHGECFKSSTVQQILSNLVTQIIVDAFAR